MLARPGTHASSSDVTMLPAARLLPFHRRALTHVMILGGDSADRHAVAISVHAESLMRSGPFVAIDCAADEPRLCGALQAWMTGMDDSSDPSILAAERGTLFLDSVEALSSRTQRLLLAFVNGTHAYGWSGRLICGASDALPECVASGEFLMPLFDDLDKARIELTDAVEGGVA